MQKNGRRSLSIFCESKDTLDEECFNFESWHFQNIYLLIQYLDCFFYERKRLKTSIIVSSISPSGRYHALQSVQALPCIPYDSTSSKEYQLAQKALKRFA
jgi:hypothetical protein